MKTNKLNNNWIHAKVTLHLSFMLLYFFFKKYERLLFSNEFLHQFCRIQFIFLSIFINIFFRDKFKNNKNRNRCAGSDRNQYLIWNERPFNKSSHRRCSVRKMFLEISTNSQENTCIRGSFLIKLQAWGLGVFLWILQNF